MIKKSIASLPEILAGDHTLLKEVLHPEKDAIALNFSLAHAIIKPNSASLPHRLQHQSETYYILKGEGKIQIEEESATLKKDDTVLVPAGALQAVENTGKENLEFLCIVSPPWTENDEAILAG